MCTSCTCQRTPCIVERSVRSKMGANRESEHENASKAEFSGKMGGFEPELLAQHNRLREKSLTNPCSYQCSRTIITIMVRGSELKFLSFCLSIDVRNHCGSGPSAKRPPKISTKYEKFSETSIKAKPAGMKSQILPSPICPHCPPCLNRCSPMLGWPPSTGAF